jgi:cell wall-associated NlpC family hydrolase
MTEAGERAAVVAEARSWVGTRYVSNADVKGAGVDCGMLLVRCFVDVGLIPAFDPRPYPAQWALHQSGERYLAFVARFADEIEGPPEPADVVVFRWGRCHSHGSIVTVWPEIIHAYGAPCTPENVEQNLMLRRLSPRFFSFWARRRRVAA